MSERTIEKVKQEYADLCLRAGNLQYQIHVQSRDLEMINQQLRDLNLEHAAMSAPKESSNG